MATEVTGRVYSYTQSQTSGWLAVKVDDQKVIRFRTDDGPWKLNEAVVIVVHRREDWMKQHISRDEAFDLLKGFSIDD